MVILKHSRVLLIIVVSAIIGLTGCKSSKPQISTAAYHVPKTECEMLTANNKVLLSVWAKGLNKQQALIAAKKKAVEEITFSGIHSGETNGVSYPLIDSPSARERNAAFFNDFFADKGKFNDFVRLANKGDEKLSHGDNFVLCQARVIVDRGALLDYFKKKKLIK